MNVLRLPRVRVSPVTRLFTGVTTRSITTTSLLAPETAPSVLRRTDKSASSSILHTSFSRTLSTDSATAGTPGADTPTSTLNPNSPAGETSLPSTLQPDNERPQLTSNPKSAHLPYQIDKTKSGNLPVFEVHRQGRIKCTDVRKVKGDIKALAEDIKKALRLRDDQVRLKELVGQVQISGGRAGDVKKFLREQGLGESFRPLTYNERFPHSKQQKPLVRRVKVEVGSEGEKK
ncbi:hypothetical protein TWF481_007637 [Arthrobotrys musiformis]|uniref:Large ribosomal subunit protein mL49 n=1 Tax=Arthrobotrys musiformis TaxID=47236 RepID=A0AAV9WD28_9PEZI